MSEENKIKLNLGCGPLKLSGYVNVDLNVEADLKHDLNEPLPYEDESVDHILASHLLEHFGYKDGLNVLKDWVRVLKPGGTLHILVPDLEACMRRFLSETGVNKWNYWLPTIYGGQWNDGEYHKNGFDSERLQAYVLNAGQMRVKEILPQDPKRTAELSIIFEKV